MRPVVRAIGRAAAAAGALVLLFVAHQLWGTSLHEAQAQDRLSAELDALLAPSTAAISNDREPAGRDVDDVAATEDLSARPIRDPGEPPRSQGQAETAPGTRVGAETAPATQPPAPVDAPVRAAPAAPPPRPGGPAARLEIPAIGVEKVVVQGADVEHLRAGPGHIPGTAMPGRPGNAAIAGHRTTYGAPFNELDELDPGDAIVTTTVEGTFVYEVTSSQIVAADAVEVIGPTDDDRLTLTTCHPEFSARQRLVVTAHLRGDPVGAVAPVEAPDAGPTRAPQAAAGVDPAPRPTTASIEDGLPAPDPADVAETPGSDAPGVTDAIGGPVGPDDAEELAALPGAGALDLGGDSGGEGGPIGPVLAWAAVCVALAVAARVVGARAGRAHGWARWAVWGLAVPVLGFGLWHLFDALALVLPAST